MPFRAALKKRIVHELSRHQTTRNIFHTPTGDIDERDAHLRADMARQKAVAESLERYAEAMRAAFAHLQEAVEALQGADLGAESKGAAFAADVLSAGLAEAQETILQMTATVQPELQAHRARIETCVEELELSDAAEQEAARYREKVAVLRGEQGARRLHDRLGAPDMDAKLTRNEAKLAAAEAAAMEARARADDAVEDFGAHRSGLGALVGAAVHGVRSALRAAAPEPAPLPAEGCEWPALAEDAESAMLEDAEVRRSLDFLVFGDDLPARPRTSLRRAPSATLGVLVATSIAMGVADADCDDTAYAAGGAPSPCCDGREHSEARCEERSDAGSTCASTVGGGLPSPPSTTISRGRGLLADPELLLGVPVEDAPAQGCAAGETGEGVAVPAAGTPLGGLSRRGSPLAQHIGTAERRPYI